MTAPEFDLPTNVFLELTGTLAADLKAEGYVAYEDFDSGQYLVYRLPQDDSPVNVSRAELTDLLRERVLSNLDAIAHGPARFGRRASADAASALRRNERGSASFLREIVEWVRETLPELSNEEVAELRARIAASRPAPKPRAPRPSRAAYFASYRAARKDAALARARSVIAKWLPLHVTPGRHALPELWDQWQAQVLPAAATQAPELADLGRNGFYAALADVAEVHSGAGGTRYVVVTNATPE